MRRLTGVPDVTPAEFWEGIVFVGLLTVGTVFNAVILGMLAARWLP